MRTHFQKVMDTLSDLEKNKDSAKAKHRQNFKYADPKVQSIMENLEKMEKGDKSGPKFHKIELWCECDDLVAMSVGGRRVVDFSFVF